MAIAFGTSAVNYVGAGTSIPVTIPTVTAGTFVLIVGMDTASTSPALTAASTGTALTQLSTTQITSSAACGIWYFIAGSTDTGKVVTLTGSATSAKLAVCLVTYTGVSGTAPIDQSAILDLVTSATSHVTPQVTTVVNNDWVIQIITIKDSTSTGWTGPGTQRAIQVGTGAGSPNVVIQDGNAADSSGTLDGGGTFTSSNGVSSSNGVCWTIAIAPPSSGTNASAGLAASTGNSLGEDDSTATGKVGINMTIQGV